MTPFIETNLYAFSDLVQQEPQLFTPEHRSALIELTKTYPDNATELSENLLAWCKSHPLIKERLESYRRTEDLSVNRLPPRVNPNSKEAERICIDTLRNALQTSVPATPPATQPSPTVPTNPSHAPR
jgi:hypothetical protein